MFSWCVVEVTELAVVSTALVPNVELPLGTVKTLLEGPFFELGSIPWETSLLQEELSLTSFFPVVRLPAPSVDLDGG